MPLRVAAISFLNPAPLLYNFEHAPADAELRTRYDVHYTLPSRCAAELHAGEADLGLIPVAELTPELRVVPGCTIASQREVRSILLLVRTHAGQSQTDALRGIRRIAADSASRSSAAYVRVLLGRFYGATPELVQHPADPLEMLHGFDAALLIGDPALLARERRAAIDREIQAGPGHSLLWIDIAQLWHEHTGLPWVAAVWAVRPAALHGSGVSAGQLGVSASQLGVSASQLGTSASQLGVSASQLGVSAGQLIADLNASREAGLAHIEGLVAEWTPRLALPPATIRTYLTENIYYHLDAPCLEAIGRFRAYAAELGVLPPLPALPLLTA